MPASFSGSTHHNTFRVAVFTEQRPENYRPAFALSMQVSALGLEYTRLRKAPPHGVGLRKLLLTTFQQVRTILKRLNA
jgi:hypothetical protein